MALVSISNIEVLDNPAKFTNPFQFEITFECLPPGITDELEWKLIYVGCATDETKDQELDSVLVGPVSVGTNKFVFQAPAPDSALIPNKDLMEVTVLLITCSYKEQEFVRIGYYVNNDYGHNEELNANPPPIVNIPALCRNILANQPRLTRFQIRWDNEESGKMGDAATPLPTNQYIEQVEDMQDEEMDDEYEGDDEDYDDEDDDDEDFEDVELSDEDQENRPNNIAFSKGSGFDQGLHHQSGMFAI